MNGIHIFHRDFRLYDNTALYELSKKCDKIILVFIFDPIQINPRKNEYFSSNCVQFMIESLEDLNNDINKRYNSSLLLFHGDTMNIIKHIKSKWDFQYLSMNMDYTPFAKKRDNEILKWAQSHNINTIYTDDICLHPIKSVLTGNGEVYKVFTPYFRAASKISVRHTEKEPYEKRQFIDDMKSSDMITFTDAHKYYKKNDNVYIRGGRKDALKILTNLKEFKDYNNERDYPAIPSTMLSAYNKFGCISIRELHEVIVSKLGKSNKLYTQLYWRDFYYNIAYEYGYVFGKAFREKYNKLKWDNNNKLFEKWMKGETGVPIIDAGMRQLNTTGFMHNRLRMMVSMYLTKDLLIDWRWGEKYFATQLIDYDPAQNNGGWQWSASTGTDSQPYFRIFNPYTMTNKVDPDGEYIKTWLPEMIDVDPYDLSKWDNNKVRNKYNIIGYPKEPIVDHKERREMVLEMFKSVI
jgi:deoxyribodipyrimidine photo-lyase